MKHTRWIVAGAWLAVVVAAASGQQPHAETGVNAVNDREAQPALQQRAPHYRLQPGDVMELAFSLSPEFNQTVTITPDGYVALRGVGDLSIAGMTIPELREALRTAYQGILHDPLVSVELKDFQKPSFTVGGEVTHPGKFDLREDVTVAEALSIAGGTTISSKSSQVLLFRRLPGGSMMEVRKLDMKKMLKKGDLSEDVHLQPGDLVYVPTSGFSKIARFLPTSSLGLYAPGIP